MNSNSVALQFHDLKAFDPSKSTYLTLSTSGLTQILQQLLLQGYIRRVSKTAKVGDDDLSLMGYSRTKKLEAKSHKFEVKSKLYYR